MTAGICIRHHHDGDGNRLEKSNGKIYWYGAGTEIIDESDTSGNFTNEYVFFGGRRRVPQASVLNLSLANRLIASSSSPSEPRPTTPHAGCPTVRGPEASGSEPWVFRSLGIGLDTDTGLVRNPKDWPWSSYRFYMKKWDGATIDGYRRIKKDPPFENRERWGTRGLDSLVSVTG